MAQPLRFEACSVARSLEAIGDYWCFLILRECFFGVHRFDALVRNIGIATNVLSQRLAHLTHHGILERRADPEDGRRWEYRLTPKGLALYPLTLGFIRWGDEWMNDGKGPPLTLIHRDCGKAFKPTMCCSVCGGPVSAHRVEYRERTTRRKPRKKTRRFSEVTGKARRASTRKR